MVITNTTGERQAFWSFRVGQGEKGKGKKWLVFTSADLGGDSWTVIKSVGRGGSR